MNICYRSECCSAEFYPALDESSKHTYNSFSLFLRFVLIVSSNKGLGLLSGISHSDILLQFYQLVFTSSCYTCRQPCICCWHFKASILVIDVSNIYGRLFLLSFETRTIILHLLKMPWIGWWRRRWGSFDDSFQKGSDVTSCSWHAYHSIPVTVHRITVPQIPAPVDIRSFIHNWYLRDGRWELLLDEKFSKAGDKGI
jgi:hypothetical protein